MERILNMRTVLQILFLAAAIVVSGCGHHGEIADFGTELYSATSGMTNAIDSSPSAYGAGQAYNDFKKTQEQLHEKWVKLLGTRLSKEDKSGLANVVFASREKLVGCFDKHAAEFRTDPRFYEAMGSLRTDFEARFNVDDIH
jgi:hypothetical protein